MNDIGSIKKLIETKFACVQVAPSIKTALGEAFGRQDFQPFVFPGEVIGCGTTHNAATGYHNVKRW